MNKEVLKAIEFVRMDEEVLDTFLLMAREEGIFPAFESAHAVAWLLRQAGQFKAEDVVIINLSGRGDKDVDAFIRYRPDAAQDSSV